VDFVSKIKCITAGILLIFLLAVWGCHSAKEIGPEKVTAEKEESGNHLVVNSEQESVSSGDSGQETVSTEESSITITGKVVIFAKGSKSETITIEVIQENQEPITYTMVGSLGYSLKNKECEMVTVIGHLTEKGFSVVPGPHLWVDEIKEE